MPGRPPDDPQFGYAAAGGQLVQPVSGVLSGGFVTDTRPPAQWVNWILNLLGAWIDFLRAASLSNWTRYTSSYTLVEAAVDTDSLTTIGTATPSYPLRRFVGLATPATTHIYVSIGGETWLQLTPTTMTGNCVALCWTHSRWLIATATPAVWWSWPDGTANVAGSSIHDQSVAWNSCTMPGGATTVLSFGAGAVGSGNVCAVDAAHVMYSTTNGTTFANGAVSASPSGTFTDVKFTGGGWVATTNAGEIYTTANPPTGTWTKSATSLGGSSLAWLLETNGSGTVLAYAAGDTSFTSWQYSTDNGATWHTTTTLYKVQRVRYWDGQWAFCSTVGMLLGVTNDPTAGNWLALPFPTVDGGGVTDSIYEIVADSEQWLALGTTFSMVSARASDIAPGPYTPGNPPVHEYDAAYIRSNLVAATTPTDGQLYRYNAADDQFEPTIETDIEFYTSAEITALGPQTRERLVFNTTTNKLNVFDIGLNAWVAV